MAKSDAKATDPEALVRPILRHLHGYTPGEQPKIPGLIKLNTNENPYGPAPGVRAALRKGIDERLRLYPNPTAERLRGKLARLHRCTPENIIVGNGSDELLALATRAFVEPLTGLTHYAIQNASGIGGRYGKHKSRQNLQHEASKVLSPSRYLVQQFQPSYSLYPVLAAIHGARPKAFPLESDFELPSIETLESGNWDFDAALTFITTPNAPSGRGYTQNQLEDLCARHRGVVVLDEAYVEFAEESALTLALQFPHVLVSRTFSKAYSLCSLRVGYFVGHPSLISALHKIRDSYNVNGLGQIAAEATLESLPYYQRNFRKIIKSREYLSAELRRLGFTVFPSQTNFILIRPGLNNAEFWQQQLRERKVLVRWFDSADTRDFLRITIGSEREVDLLLKAVCSVLKRFGTSPSRRGRG